MFDRHCFNCLKLDSSVIFPTLLQEAVELAAGWQTREFRSLLLCKHFNSSENGNDCG